MSLQLADRLKELLLSTKNLVRIRRTCKGLKKYIKKNMLRIKPRCDRIMHIKKITFPLLELTRLRRSNRDLRDFIEDNEAKLQNFCPKRLELSIFVTRFNNRRVSEFRIAVCGTNTIVVPDPLNQLRLIRFKDILCDGLRLNCLLQKDECIAECPIDRLKCHKSVLSKLNLACETLTVQLSSLNLLPLFEYKNLQVDWLEWEHISLISHTCQTLDIKTMPGAPDYTQFTRFFAVRITTFFADSTASEAIETFLRNLLIATDIGNLTTMIVPSDELSKSETFCDTMGLARIYEGPSRSNALMYLLDFQDTHTVLIEFTKGEQCRLLFFQKNLDDIVLNVADVFFQQFEYFPPFDLSCLYEGLEGLPREEYKDHVSQFMFRSLQMSILADKYDLTISYSPAEEEGFVLILLSNNFHVASACTEDEIRAFADKFVVPVNPGTGATLLTVALAYLRNAVQKTEVALLTLELEDLPPPFEPLLDELPTLFSTPAMELRCAILSLQNLKSIPENTINGIIGCAKKILCLSTEILSKDCLDRLMQKSPGLLMLQAGSWFNAAVLKETTQLDMLYLKPTFAEVKSGKGINITTTAVRQYVEDWLTEKRSPISTSFVCREVKNHFAGAEVPRELNSVTINSAIQLEMFGSKTVP